MGRYEEAIADAGKIRELNPDNPGVATALVFSYLRLGQMDRLRALNDELR
ncbi:MAG: tetratricopeptide repeat protein, partial [Candidatus Heimdallarchaeota archaeon]